MNSFNHSSVYIVAAQSLFYSTLQLQSDLDDIPLTTYVDEPGGGFYSQLKCSKATLSGDSGFSCPFGCTQRLFIQFSFSRVTAELFTTAENEQNCNGSWRHKELMKSLLRLSNFKQIGRPLALLKCSSTIYFLFNNSSAWYQPKSRNCRNRWPACVKRTALWKTLQLKLRG